ncbi:BarD [Burkholderia pseudomallei]|nr:BarD [Burkholderia pseudomallei]
MARHIVQAIQSHAFATPYKCALSDSRGDLGYADLDSFSTRFAMRLQDLGCRPGDRVVMLASRRALLVAAIIGVFKAGCVHVPLDPRMPADRLRYILHDVAPTLVIADEDLIDVIEHALPAAAPIVPVTELERLLDDADSPRLDALVQPLPLPPLDERAIAYCIYTSGSTGRPKGVLINHRSIADFFEGTRAVYDVTAQSRCASFSPLNFDVYLMDMLFPLAQGASLYVHDDVNAPDLLFDAIRAHDVTHFSAWGMMLGLIAQAEEFEAAPLPHLKTILTGTDVPDVKTVQRWLRKNAGVQVINAYGPTEATCAATAHVIREIEPERRTLYPIGKPLEHVRALLVDEGGNRITAPGVPGELMIGGTQVMQGYWNLPEETAARLVRLDGVPFYRTGDVCAYLADGSLYYMGRKDNEVKIGGYRIHLSEIQRVINSVPHVYGSEVVLLESRYGETLLAAGVLLERGAPLDADCKADEIRQRLAAELPAYMVPRHVKVLEQFPQLSSGKTDRKALLSILQQRINESNQEEVNS